MDDAPQPASPERDERRADVERRLDEATGVLVETLLDMWRAKRNAEREGRAWPPPEPPKPEPARRPLLIDNAPKRPPRRVFRALESSDKKVARKLLDETWFPTMELSCEPFDGRRYRAVLEYGGLLLGVAVFDEYGDAAVLRAIAIRKAHRRQGHGRALAAHIARRAYENGVGRVYCAAASPWFVEEIGFEYRERMALPEDAARLPGIIDALPTAHIFELTPTNSGYRTPRRMFPRSATEFLTRQSFARSPGPSGKQKRHEQSEGGP